YLFATAKVCVRVHTHTSSRLSHLDAIVGLISLSLSLSLSRCYIFSTKFKLKLDQHTSFLFLHISLFNSLYSREREAILVKLCQPQQQHHHHHHYNEHHYNHHHQHHHQHHPIQPAWHVLQSATKSQTFKYHRLYLTL